MRFDFIMGVHAFLVLRGKNYVLIIHEDVQSVLNIRHISDIFFIDEDVNPIPEVSIEVKKFDGEPMEPIFYFHNMSCIFGVKPVMLSKKDYATLKIKF